ncbi:putative colanic acid biosynthesis acetyltransferase [Pseudocolwellia sp. HL-MZ7]|uniref:putative colanic acid biosynthesis acetyltransferase n=1 Tax=Pseudocolwellia sp. HL-MZ7 TaxID=3400627 RepID=UPI003CF05338
MSSVTKQKETLTSPTFSLQNKLIRVIWRFVYIVFFRFSPVPLFKYRNFILKLFGANLQTTSRIYPSVSIWLPANLSIGSQSTLGPFVDVYNQGKITIGDKVIVSQGAHLCASTHDYNDPLHPLLLAPINVSNDVWICAEAFIGPNVAIDLGCVVGARAVLTKSTEEWTVYGGNPAKALKKRTKFNE